MKRRDKYVVPVANALLRLASPEYRDALKRVILDGARSRIQAARVIDGHEIEIEFDGFPPSVTLIHPASGGDCPPAEGETEGCWLTDWLENEGVELLRGKLTLPVKWEFDRDHPLFHLQSPTPPALDAEDGERWTIWKLRDYGSGVRGPDTEPVPGLTAGVEAVRLAEIEAMPVASPQPESRQDGKR